MTALGLFCYLAAVAAAWLFHLAYLGWYGSFLLWAVIFLPPLFSLFSLPAMLCLRMDLSAPAEVFRHEKAALTLRFRSRLRFPVGKLRLRLRAENLYTGQVHHFRYSFDAVSPSLASLPLPTEDCGLLVVTLERWSCSDVLGLLTLCRACPAPLRCVVLPRPAEPDSAVSSESDSATQPRLKPKYGGGFAEDHELRAYQPGDSVNSIHWKLSSKTDSLIVREPLVPENDTVYLILQEAGSNSRGLQSLFWLSQFLNQREIPHKIVANDVYGVSDDRGTLVALTGILSVPSRGPVACPLNDARAVYTVRGGEVTVQ